MKATTAPSARRLVVWAHLVHTTLAGTLAVAVGAVPSALAAEPAPPQASAPLQVHAREAMHTRFEAHLPGGAPPPAAMWAALMEVEALANEWRPGSPLAEFNAHAGSGWRALPAKLVALLAAARAIAEASAGAFDPTWAALWGLWDLNAPTPRPPPAADVRARLHRIGWRRLEVDVRGSRARVGAGAVVGLGGVAKGAALDVMAAALDATGVARYALSAGGQVLVRGERAPGQPWHVGVRDPRGAGPDDALLSLAVRDVSVSTSGDYERFFVHEGVRYHHLLDPRTGWPARGLRSATVVHPRALMADAWSTAVFVAGPAAAPRLCARLQREGGGCVLVDDDGAVQISASLLPAPWQRPGLRWRVLAAAPEGASDGVRY